MKRVLLIGCGGAGKSTLALRMGGILNLPVIHLDQHYWQEGWVETPDDEWHGILEGLIAQDAWIMDGNYNGTLEMRLQRADTVVLLDFPRRKCLWRVLRRVWKHRGTTRPDLADGCPERFDWEFLGWIWRFPKDVRPRQLEILERHRDTHRVEVLRNDRDIEAFVAGLSPAS